MTAPPPPPPTAAPTPARSLVFGAVAGVVGAAATALLWRSTGTVTFWPPALAMIGAFYAGGTRAAIAAAALSLGAGVGMQVALQPFDRGVGLRLAAMTLVFVAGLFVMRRSERAERRTREGERDLRAERDLLEGILATSAAGIVVVSRSGEITFANRRAESILGLTRDAITSRRYDSPEWGVTDLDGGPWPDAKQPVARILAEEEPVYDVRHAIVWPDGRRRYLSVNAAPMRDAGGRVIAAVAAVDDITAAVEAERALAASREREQRILATSPGVLYEYEARADGTHGFSFVAPRAGELLGLDANWMCADADAVWARILPEHVPALQAAMAESAKTLAPWREEFRYRDDAGHVRWMRMEALATRGADGAARWSGLMTDVSARKELEASLARAQKLEGLGRLAGGLAHDFNNILTVIHAGAESARDALAADHDARRDLDEVLHAADRASALTRQLLTLSRRQVLAPKPLDLRAVVREMGAMATRVLGGAIRLVIDAPGSGATVVADRSQLEQVLLNLVVNAREAMPDGGTLTFSVRDRVREGPPELTADRWCVVEVHDTGAGMDEETQRRVFDPFFTTKAEGTGLGLATSFASVRQMGGTITVESRAGSGSRFRVWLPQTDPTTPEQAFSATPRSEVPIVARRHVLIVDDDDAVREVMRRELSSVHDVHVARSGDEALRIADALGERLALMVTDIMMPGMRGPDLAARLAERWPSVRILFVTGFPGDRGTDGALDAPGTALLAKPFAGTQLRQAVADLLGDVPDPTP